VVIQSHNKNKNCKNVNGVLNMKKIDAETLWNRIVDFADATAEVAGEGNSGEFSSEEGAADASRDLNRASSRLISTFSNLTGWVPKYFEGSPKEHYQDAGWSLISARGKKSTDLDILRKIMGEWHTVEIPHARGDWKAWWELWQILKDKKPFYDEASFHCVEKRYRHNKQIYHAFWWNNNSFDDGRPNEIAIRENYNWDEKKNVNEPI
jgi:hypothetical protein